MNKHTPYFTYLFSSLSSIKNEELIKKYREENTDELIVFFDNIPPSRSSLFLISIYNYLGLNTRVYFVNTETGKRVFRKNLSKINSYEFPIILFYSRKLYEEHKINRIAFDNIDFDNYYLQTLSKHFFILHYSGYNLERMIEDSKYDKELFLLLYYRYINKTSKDIFNVHYFKSLFNNYISHYRASFKAI